MRLMPRTPGSITPVHGSQNPHRPLPFPALRGAGAIRDFHDGRRGRQRAGPDLQEHGRRPGPGTGLPSGIRLADPASQLSPPRQQQANPRSPASTSTTARPHSSSRAAAAASSYSRAQTGTSAYSYPCPNSATRVHPSSSANLNTRQLIDLLGRLDRQAADRRATALGHERSLEIRGNGR
jgi:hypothetical protein